ncbi:MAG: response regulator transcription factor [Nitrospirota bacterium]
MQKPRAKPIRVLLVDDHAIVRVGLRTALSRAKSIEVVGEAGTAADAVAEACRLKPDVVLMDVRLPDGSGIEACREIQARCADCRVLFLTSYSDEDAVTASIFAGAHGYLLKEIGVESLIRAVETVAAGQSILDPSLAQRALARVKSLSEQAAQGKKKEEEEEEEQLSAQEQRVLALVAKGKTNKEIAAALGLSDKTVKNYLSHVFQKLQVTRRSQAVALFVKKSGQ